MRDVTAREVHRIVDQQEEAILVDALGPESYARHHLPGSINIPAGDPRFLEKLEREVPDKRATLVFYCSGPTCGASPAAAQRAEEAGYQDVREFRGGLQEWGDSGYSFEGQSRAI